jgi:hypothetical protein
MGIRSEMGVDVRRLVIGALAIGMSLTLLLPAAVSAAPRPITLFVSVLDTNHCLEGRVKNNATVNVTLRSSSGNVRGVGRNIPADADGFWSFCVYRGPVIHSGDSITVKVQETHQLRTVTVPQLSVRVDRDADTVYGYGPANETLSVNVWDFQQIVSEYDITENVTTSSTGHYGIDFSNQADLVGDAVAIVTWASPEGDLFDITGGAPFISVKYASANFTGETNRGDRLKVTLKDSNGDVIAKGNEVGFECCQGVYDGNFYRDRNHEYEVVGGEQVIGPALGSDTGWVVPEVEGKVILSTDVVTGTCFPNQPLFVESFNFSGDYGVMDGRADADGKFSLDMSSAINIKGLYVVDITCLAPTGDRVFHEFVTQRQ